MTKTKMRKALKSLNISSSKHHYSNGRRTEFNIKIDFQEILDKWDDIKNTVEDSELLPLNEYDCINTFIKHIKLIKSCSYNPPRSKRSFSINYIDLNTDSYFETINSIFKKTILNKNYSKIKEPTLYLKEINTNEGEAWYFGIRVDLVDTNDLLTFVKKINDTKYKDAFRVYDYVFKKEYIAFQWFNMMLLPSSEYENSSSNGYMPMFNNINSNLDLKKLNSLDDYSLFDALYKGGIENYKID